MDTVTHIKGWPLYWPTPARDSIWCRGADSEHPTLPPSHRAGRRGRPRPATRQQISRVSPLPTTLARFVGASMLGCVPPSGRRPPPQLTSDESWAPASGSAGAHRATGGQRLWLICTVQMPTRCPSQTSGSDDGSGSTHESLAGPNVRVRPCFTCWRPLLVALHLPSARYGQWGRRPHMRSACGGSAAMMDLSSWCISGRATSRLRSCHDVRALRPHPTSQSLDVDDVSVTAEVGALVDGSSLWTAVALHLQIARVGLLRRGNTSDAGRTRRSFPLLS